jgi:kynurenine formamidase
MPDESATKDSASTKKMVKKKSGAAKKKVAKRAMDSKTKTPTATSGSESAHGSKAAFIRKHPDLKPKALSELAKSKGMKIGASYISTQRSNDKKAGKSPGSKRKAGRPKASNTEREFRDLLIRLGVDRAEDLIASFRAQLQR